MSGINNIQNEKIRQLATTLRQSGLAASETEAIRMATSMASTNSKVQQTFEDRKERNVMGLTHLKKQEEQQTKSTVSPEAMTAQKIPVRMEEEEVAVRQTNSTTAPLTNDDKDENLDLDLDKEQEFLVQDVIKTEEAPKPTPVQAQPIEAPVQNAAPTERPAPKRDINSLEESKVDLTSVFGFKG